MTWRRLSVAPDNTHHLDEQGAPAYPERFEEVHKFHPPGLAPVRRGQLGWHIQSNGTPAYERCFHRTFGFYEGLAAVVDADGWHHIDSQGMDAYGSRFAWCGNMQGGRSTIRDGDGAYYHVDASGGPVYRERWRYAGDFRDGIAVVQAADGRSTHIARCGAMLHRRWFEDLDVFHKGFARARDSGGWMHIDRCGRSIYARRFAAVEPFYNSQARVERFDGGFEVIDETGNTLMDLRPAKQSQFSLLSSDMVGFWRTETIAGAVSVGLFDALPGTTVELADRLGLHAKRLVALMRALCELRLIRREGDVWVPTERGILLRSDHEWTLADAASEYADPMRKAWKQLIPAIRDKHWQSPDVFGDVAQDPLRIATHHRMLRSYARHDYALVPHAIDLQGHERVIDVGGGTGTLSELLLDRYPSLSVLVLDRPEVVALVPVRPGLRAVAADFFEPLALNADVAVLARVVHDWPDDRAIHLLRNVRSALRRDGRVFLVEFLVDDDGTCGGLCDLHVLLATGGRERTANEYEILLNASGFELTEIRTLCALPSVLVGVAR